MTDTDDSAFPRTKLLKFIMMKGLEGKKNLRFLSPWENDCAQQIPQSVHYFLDISLFKVIFYLDGSNKGKVSGHRKH